MPGGRPEPGRVSPGVVAPGAVAYQNTMGPSYTTPPSRSPSQGLGAREASEAKSVLTRVRNRHMMKIIIHDLKIFNKASMCDIAERHPDGRGSVSRLRDTAEGTLCEVSEEEHHP